MICMRDPDAYVVRVYAWSWRLCGPCVILTSSYVSVYDPDAYDPDAYVVRAWSI